MNKLNENLQDYYADEILGKSIILRDLLNIEFPLNALTNELGEYIGYEEEDFTEEELDSYVTVTDIYTDADGLIGAEIKGFVRNVLTPEEFDDVMFELGRDEVKNNDLMNKLRDYTNWKHEYYYDAYKYTTDEDKKIITDIVKREAENYWKARGFEEKLNENKTLTEDRLELVMDINPNIIVQQINIRDIKKAIRSRRSGGEDEQGSGGLWDLAFEETLNHIFWEVGVTDLNNKEHQEYILLAEEVYDILIANEENYVNGRRPILDESVLNENIALANKLKKDAAIEIMELIKVYYGDIHYSEMIKVREYIIVNFLDDLTIEELSELNVNADLQRLLKIAAKAAQAVEEIDIRLYNYRFPINEQTLTENIEDKKYIIKKVKVLINDWYNDLDDDVFHKIEDYLNTVVFPEISKAEITEIAEDKDSIYYLAKKVDENIVLANLTEQTLNEGTINFTYSDYDLPTYVLDLEEYLDEYYDEEDKYFFEEETMREIVKMVKLANQELKEQQSRLVSELSDKEVAQILEELGHGLYDDDDYNRDALEYAEILELGVWPGYYQGVSIGFNYVDPDLIRIRTEGSPITKDFANSLIVFAEGLLAEIAEETNMRKARSGGYRGPIYESKTLTEDITEDNLTIVLNFVFNTEEGGDQYGDSFLYDIDIWKGNDRLYPLTKPVYQTYEEMMNGEDYDINYALRQALQEAYPEYIIDYAELKVGLYDMTAIINYRDEDDNYIDTQVPVQLVEVEDTAWDDETRLSFWA